MVAFVVDVDAVDGPEDAAAERVVEGLAVVDVEVGLDVELVRVVDRVLVVDIDFIFDVAMVAVNCDQINVKEIWTLLQHYIRFTCRFLVRR